MAFFRFRSPEYLQLTATGIYTFRFRVPSEFQHCINRTEFKYSLKTRNIREARLKVYSILEFMEESFQKIRSGVFSDYSIEKLTKHLKEGINQARFYLLPNGTSTCVPSFVDSSKHSEVVRNEPEPKQDTQLVTEQSQTTFEDVEKNFLKEKKLSKEWRYKTEEDHLAVFNLFKEIHGKNLPTTSIDKPLMRDFKSTIMCLPPNMRKLKQYRNKTIPQILAMNVQKTISPHTINKYLTRLSNLFSFAVSNGYMESNPASGLKVKLKARPDEERKIYTKEDLRKLFTDPDTKAPYMYWTPLIAIYTGCRLEEICQLHLEDIRQEQGVWVFDINDKGNKQLKNLSSRRLIPIHPELIKAGLLDYHSQLLKKGKDRLFPEINRRRDGYGQTVSKWFYRYKKRCGIIDPDQNFHSFRHTFITHLKHKQVDPFIIHELDGHSIDSETMGRYGKRYTPEILMREGIEKIDYEGLNIPPTI